jgi:hypothetical protein
MTRRASAEGRIAAFGRRLRSLWPGPSILAPLPFAAHAAWCAARADLRFEHVAILALVLALFTAGPRAKRLLVGAYPIGLVGIFYDAMRALPDAGLTPARVHLCDLRAREIALFGIEMNGRPATVHDWLQAHPSPVLDVVCAIPYGTFLFACVACAIWLYAHDYPRMVRFGWCFLALNVAGFVTYRLYPAAPPWYFHAHGCEVDVLARASEGPNLARVDAWLGVPYFAGMYRRAARVFGAMPSLHCAYPVLILLVGWASFPRALRAAAAAFAVLMWFAAVYLDHHWVLDAAAGTTYAAAIAALARLSTRISRRPST